MKLTLSTAQKKDWGDTKSLKDLTEPLLPKEQPNSSVPSGNSPSDAASDLSESPYGKYSPGNVDELALQPDILNADTDQLKQFFNERQNVKQLDFSPLAEHASLEQLQKILDAVARPEEITGLRLCRLPLIAEPDELQTVVDLHRFTNLNMLDASDPPNWKPDIAKLLAKLPDTLTELRLRKVNLTGVDISSSFSQKVKQGLRTLVLEQGQLPHDIDLSCFEALEVLDIAHVDYYQNDKVIDRDNKDPLLNILAQTKTNQTVYSDAARLRGEMACHPVGRGNESLTQVWTTPHGAKFCVTSSPSSMTRELRRSTM